MRIYAELNNCWPLLRLLNAGEIAYLSLRPGEFGMEVEFPTEWHDRQRAWFRLSLLLFTVAISIPWSRVAPDYMQCCGPKYGFRFHSGALWLYFGQDKGTRDDPTIAISMPWEWRFSEEQKFGSPTTFSYRYECYNGDVQDRKAAIQKARRTWRRPWIPWSRSETSIEVEFDQPIGEGVGSWKGGVCACGYEMLPGEDPVQTLRRMERERRFSR